MSRRTPENVLAAVRLERQARRLAQEVVVAFTGKEPAKRAGAERSGPRMLRKIWDSVFRRGGR